MVATSELTKLPTTLPPVQLIHRQLPHREGPAGADCRAYAPVRHSSVKCVRPDGNPTEGSGQRGVVKESLVGHHLKLLIATSPEKRGSESEDRRGAQIGKALDHQSCARHLLQPHVVATLSPILGVWLVCH